MVILMFLTIFVTSIVAVPQHKNQEVDVEKLASTVFEAKTLIKPETSKKSLKKQIMTKSLMKDCTKKPTTSDKNGTREDLPKKNRKQKASYLSQGNSYEPTFVEQNFEDTSSRPQYQESNVYYIKLPPTPHIFVPGLGYISHPPSYSFGKPKLPSKFHQNQVSLVKVPIDFVSNGKPTSIYSYSETDNDPNQSQTLRLNKGPYVFNGSPMSLYLLGPSGRPVQRISFRQTNHLKKHY